MRVRYGTVVTAAGALALILLGGPMLAGPARAAGPAVVVRWGDTLSGIAARFDTTVARLVALNHLSDPNLIFPGQVVVLAPTKSVPEATKTISVVVHVVLDGETLTGIAARYATSIASIVAANGLTDPNHIVTGQRLRIPVRSASQARHSAASGSVASTTTYVVQAGETLTGIARRHGTTVAMLFALNRLPSSGLIRIGQHLLVPSRQSSSATETGWTTDQFPADVQARMARRATIRALIVDEARRAGVPVPLALAVAWQESGWRQHVVSDAGAVGVMQLLPGTAAWIADSMLQAPVNIHGARSNVRAGVTLLKHYLLRYRGDRRRALAAYYQGQAAVDRDGIFAVSEPYIDSILLLEEMFQP